MSCFMINISINVCKIDVSECHIKKYNNACENISQIVLMNEISHKEKMLTKYISNCAYKRDFT